MRSRASYWRSRWHVRPPVLGGRTVGASAASLNSLAAAEPERSAEQLLAQDRPRRGEHCVLMLGSHHDPQFSSGFDEMRRFFETELPKSPRVEGSDLTSVPTFYAGRRGGLSGRRGPGKPFEKEPPRRGQWDGDVVALIENVQYLRDDRGCRDILFYIAGHGNTQRRGSSPSSSSASGTRTS